MRLNRAGTCTGCGEGMDMPERYEVERDEVLLE